MRSENTGEYKVEEGGRRVGMEMSRCGAWVSNQEQRLTVTPTGLRTRGLLGYPEGGVREKEKRAQG